MNLRLKSCVWSEAFTTKSEVYGGAGCEGSRWSVSVVFGSVGFQCATLHVFAPCIFGQQLFSVSGCEPFRSDQEASRFRSKITILILNSRFRPYASFLIK